MPEKTPVKSVRTILDGTNGLLKTLVESCARAERVAKLVAGQLPEPLARHCRAANLADGILTLHSDSPVWTTRLRFVGPRLLESLRRHPDLGEAREVRIRSTPVLPARSAHHPLRPLPRLSPAAANHLREAALTISAPALRAALLRLARQA
jgi:hypothetical protein